MGLGLAPRGPMPGCTPGFRHHSGASRALFTARLEPHWRDRRGGGEAGPGGRAERPLQPALPSKRAVLLLGHGTALLPSKQAGTPPQHRQQIPRRPRGLPGRALLPDNEGTMRQCEGQQGTGTQLQKYSCHKSPLPQGRLLPLHGCDLQGPCACRRLLGMLDGARGAGQDVRLPICTPSASLITGSAVERRSGVAHSTCVWTPHRRAHPSGHAAGPRGLQTFRRLWGAGPRS